MVKKRKLKRVSKSKKRSSSKKSSKENRILFFEGHKKHSSSTCTNAKARFNININYK